MDHPRSALPDWAYPAEDDVPESMLHLRLRTMLYLLVRHYLAERGVRALTGSEQFIYFVEGNPRRSLAPDVYVILDEDPERIIRTWKTWQEGRAPDLGVEIVSDDPHKDYVWAPLRYAEAGVRELIVFDPFDGPERYRWHVYRRDEAGDLVRVARSSDDRTWSEVLQCHLRWIPEGEDGAQLRLGEGPNGGRLVPTAVEQERAAKEAERVDKEAERAAKEAERAAKEIERTDKEAERARRRALEIEVEALRKQLAERDSD